MMGAVTRRRPAPEPAPAGSRLRPTRRRPRAARVGRRRGDPAAVPDGARRRCSRRTARCVDHGAPRASSSRTATPAGTPWPPRPVSRSCTSTPRCRRSTVRRRWPRRRCSTTSPHWRTPTGCCRRGPAGGPDEDIAAVRAGPAGAGRHPGARSRGCRCPTSAAGSGRPAGGRTRRRPTWRYGATYAEELALARRPRLADGRARRCAGTCTTSSTRMPSRPPSSTWRAGSGWAGSEALLVARGRPRRDRPGHDDAVDLEVGALGVEADHALDRGDLVERVGVGPARCPRPRGRRPGTASGASET